jgi:predicted GIY-YIG superfamily endonuclease
LRLSEVEGEAHRVVFVHHRECRWSFLITGDIERRFKEHIEGEGGRYTRRNRPKRVVYTEEFESKDKAEARERQIKRWSRAKKKALINGDLAGLKQLSISRD